ncbi:dihydrolipoamide acetyltransferase family protein [Mucilaginibacter gotjawali]|uniref:Dihydrolipoamide acetyltransferase component of pyruvate dehydrogenase complex n=2 Tax=Mucilaginibacter gotjawali TaxID=1550579 RepID=A0A120MYC3_9SPHI|nr:dihydrolipoamide acetyltransferase family protein [Mucilaginibacter gotjawali]MBB3058237.1 2-oxoglutarate dehydrogenase E2 component (dihydrolipoamide succinyltransferase) [Mucilaginibacter gotjawali]BAU54807.1 Dihydrolipoyllysine-residue acetyltransferase component of pyruvate dehydrogenase complex [Mucilaginibacter gotjawali]
MAQYKLLLPKMGESVAEATVIRWTKNPGDHVEADDTVMEIATDKVDSEVPSPVSGKLLERFYKDNDVVQVGAVIAIIETADPEEIVTQKVTVNAPVIEATQATPPVPEVQIAAPVAEVQQAAPVAEVPPPVYQAPQPEAKPAEELKQPVFAEQREELTPPVPYTENLDSNGGPKPEDGLKNGLRFYSPLVKNIAAQEGISNAELDKIPGTGAEGRLTKDDLLNYIGNRYTITSPTTGAPVEATPTGTDTNGPEPVAAPTVPEPVTKAPVTEPVFEAPPVAPVFEAPKPEPVIEAPKPAPVFEAPKPEHIFEQPKAEAVSQQAAESAVKSSVSMSGNDEIIEMDRMRRLIADHMVMSKHTSPHVTSFVEADVTNLVLWREKIKNAFEKREGEKITFTPIFIEAVVRAIKDMPMINIQVNGTQIIKKKDINISMATALPSGNLIVPVIKRADELNLIGLTKSVNDLANRARTGKLKPDDVQGGTFTITNVGSFGNVMGTPIINQPQVAILAVGAIKKKPAVIETLQGDMIGIRHMMFLSLSYDHRVVDGALGGSFVRRVADYLENWDPGREI